MPNWEDVAKTGADVGLAASGPPGWAILGANALAGLFSGMSQANTQKAGIREQKREFDISGAAGPTRALEGLPLRDRLMHVLLSRFGNNPSTYAGAQASYTPGAGGTGPSGDIYREMLRRMGYNYGGGPGPGPSGLTHKQRTLQKMHGVQY